MPTQLIPLPKEPSVTIVTVYYNRESVVSESVKSLLAQTYHKTKILLVDDGSTDNTLIELQKFDIHKNVHIVTGINIGFTKAIRRSISEHTNTDLIAIHGSGDISYPERIAKQAQALVKNPDWAMVGCWVNNTTEDGKNIIYHQRAEPVEWKDLLTSNYYTQGEVMFRRDAYIAAGGYRTAFTVAQDRDMWLRLLHFGNGGFVQEFLYERFIRADGVHLNPYKKCLQKAMSNAAIKCAVMKQECGTDIVDLVGDAGVLLLNGDQTAADYFLTRKAQLGKNQQKEKEALEVMAALVRCGDDQQLFQKYRQGGRYRTAWKATNRLLMKTRTLMASLIKLF